MKYKSHYNDRHLLEFTINIIILRLQSEAFR